MANKAVIKELQAKIDSFGSAGMPMRFGEETPLVPDNRDLDEGEDAFKKVVALVNVSDRSERTVRDRLSRSGFEEASIEEAVTRAKDYGFIDDSRFAVVLVRSRLAQGRGRVGIERELQSHGIDIDTVEGWPHEFDVDDETEMARALDFLERKPPRSKNMREGAFRKLVSRGYSSSIAAKAARTWSEGRGDAL